MALRRPLITTIAACVALSIGSRIAPAAEVATHHPVVIGYERFAADDVVGAGELLIGELNCVACHQASASDMARFMPKRAPLLDGVTLRLRPSWLRRYLHDPRGAKPGVTMPDVLRAVPEAEREATVDALLQYLVSLPPDDASPKIATDLQASIERGRTLYHTVGCVACHEPGDNYNPLSTPNDPFATTAIKPPPRAVPSVPLGDLRLRYQPGQLAVFLKDPLHFRPAGRMPRIRLADQEAMDLAAYLTRGEAVEDETAIQINASKVERGRSLFASLGCAACHLDRDGTPYVASQLHAPTLAGLTEAIDRGCMSAARDQHGVKAPRYGLSDNQRQAIATALNASKHAPQSTDASRLTHAMLALNCFACHNRATGRDGATRGGPEPGRADFFVSTVEADLGDEGRLPPALTGVGAKLTHDALQAIIRDGGDARPYMATRMPAFGDSHARALSELLERVDLPADAPVTDLTGEEKQARNAYGRELIGVTGLNCVTCHTVRGHRSLGIPAIDLALAPKRLRPSWFKAYLLDPARYKPGTRMPDLFPEGRSAIKRVLGGDGPQQIDAIWTYLKEIEQTRLPEGIERTDHFVLKPTTEPIVFRTFVKGAGTHAIAIGYPPSTNGASVNLAFDSEAVRWAIAWRGAFIDAQATWDDRFTPWTEPLGKDVLTMPAGPNFAVLDSDKSSWPARRVDTRDYTFTGYTLDAQRRPHMRYAFQRARVDDLLAPSLRDGHTLLRRTITIDGRIDNLWLRVLTGKTIKRDDSGSFVSSDGWQVRLITPSTSRAVVRAAANDGQELIVPVDTAKEQTTIELEMRWVRE